MHKLVPLLVVASVALASCSSTSGGGGPAGPVAASSGGRSVEVTDLARDEEALERLTVDEVAPRGVTPVAESHWSHPRLHVESASVEGATRLNEKVAAAVTERVQRYREDSGPVAGSAPVELVGSWASIADADGVVGLRTFTSEFAGASSSQEVAALYGTRDGSVAWTGADLVRPDARQRLVGVLQARVGAAGSTAEAGEPEDPTRVLRDVEFSRGGDLRVVVAKDDLGLGKGLAIVTVPAAEATPYLTDAGTRVRAAFAASTPAPTAEAAPTVTPAGQDTSSVDCAQVKCVALTFDDGPGPYTDKIVDTLVQHHAKGTFFMIGRSVQAMPATARRVHEKGMAIGDHTWTHVELNRVSAARADSELARTASAIWNATGAPPVAARPPYGAFTPRTPHQGLPFILWDVDTEDWKNRNAEETTRRALATVHPGAIILMHDIHPSTAQALEGIVTSLQGQGYTLVTVPELLGAMDPAKAYFSGKAPQA